MKKIKSLIMILVVALVFGVMPHNLVFASTDNPFDNGSEINFLGLCPFTSDNKINYFVREGSNFYEVYYFDCDVSKAYFQKQYSDIVVELPVGTKKYAEIEYSKVTGKVTVETNKSQSTISTIVNGSPYSDVIKATFDIYANETSDEVVISPEVDKDRVDEMPSDGNGIYITSFKDGDKYNTKKDLLGYGVRYKVKGRYKMDFDFVAGDEADKLQIINSISSTNDYRVWNFKWIKSPTEQAFKDRTVEFELELISYFDSLGEKDINVTMKMDVDKDSTDFVTKQKREYTDSVKIELVSEESSEEGVIGGDSSGDITSDEDGDILDFPTAPDSSNVLDWIKYFAKLWMWFVTFPFRILVNVFKVLTGYITEMVTLLTDTSKQITGLFTFIPDDILQVTYGVISFTLLYSVVKGVLGMIRGVK